MQQAARLLCAHCLGLPGLPVGGACLVGAKITCICITSHEAPNSAPLTSSGVAARPAATITLTRSSSVGVCIYLIARGNYLLATVHLENANLVGRETAAKTPGDGI